MRTAGAIVVAALLGGCAHMAAPAGWDCRASIEQGGVKATAWQHLSPRGRVVMSSAQWKGPSMVADTPGITLDWESSGEQLDWLAGRAEIFFYLDPRSPHRLRRLEIHAASGRLFRGSPDRAPILLLSLPPAHLQRAAAAQRLQLVVVEEPTRAVLRTGLDSTLLDRGLALAVQAFARATAKRGDYRRQCDPAPVIVVT